MGGVVSNAMDGTTTDADDVPKINHEGAKGQATTELGADVRTLLAAVGDACATCAGSSFCMEHEV